MSTTSKKNDPFHFDEIYKQAGVEDVFVKKTMGELKQKQHQGVMPSCSSVQPAAAATAFRPPPSPANIDLDFLTTIATQGGTSPSLSKHGSTSNLPGQTMQQQQQQAHMQAFPTVKALDDPFALFEEVAGAVPPQKHATPPVPAAGAATGMLLDFDLGHAAAQPTQPTPSASPQQQNLAATQSLGLSAPLAPQPPPPDYSDHIEHRTAPPGPMPTAHTLATAGAGAHPAPSTVRDYHSGRGEFVPSPSTSAAGAAVEYRPPYVPEQQLSRSREPQPTPLPLYSSQQYHNISGVAESSQPSNSSSSFSWGHTPSGSGISGYLKAFGKKAVRVAKAGLVQLEHALEGLDQAAQLQQQQQYSHSSIHGASWGKSDNIDVSNDEALAWAVRLADLPPHAQQQELSHMMPPLRRKVIEVLREQVRSEHEAATGGTAYIHGSPLPPPPRGSHDGAPLGQHPGGPGGRVDMVPETNAAPQPPAYSDAIQHPGVLTETLLPQPPPAADLLGLGGSEVLPKPTSMATASAVPSSMPALDDLLGFDDHAPQARALASAATSSAAARQSSSKLPHSPPASSRVAGPAAAVSPQAPPTAVHIDDMDEFFSGGKTSAPAVGSGGIGSGLAMHSSSSAPNLRGARAAVPASAAPAAIGSSSATALVEMLHGSDDERGAGGVDVDVSGYADLYKGEQGSADEPEIRRRLRAQREAAKHAKMKAALAEKLVMEAEEAARREEQVALKDQYKLGIEAWKNRNKGNIRGLLGSLHTVLWPNSGWLPVSVGDLLEPAQVKRVYMRANLLVHPDKVRQRNGSAEQVAIADMVFDVLKEAWNVFR